MAPTIPPNPLSRPKTKIITRLHNKLNVHHDPRSLPLRKCLYERLRMCTYNLGYIL
jgi:hypothetical protein